MFLPLTCVASRTPAPLLNVTGPILSAYHRRPCGWRPLRRAPPRPGAAAQANGAGITAAAVSTTPDYRREA